MSALGGLLRAELEASEFRHLKDVTVLIADNDPYRQDVERKLVPAQWFAAQVRARRAGFPGQTLHLRGWHYVLLGSTRWDGQPYINTYDQWNELLTKAADGARWNGLLPFDEIIDARNLEPVLRLQEQAEPRPSIAIPEAELRLPPYRRPWPLLELGEDEALVRQEHRLAIIGEKSSLEPVLGPISAQYGTDLLLPTGEASESMIYRLARAADEDSRRLIVFYLADFGGARADPRGAGRRGAEPAPGRDRRRHLGGARARRPARRVRAAHARAPTAAGGDGPPAPACPCSRPRGAPDHARQAV